MNYTATKVIEMSAVLVLWIATMPSARSASLDRQPTKDAQFELWGRIAKIPVSWFFKRTLNVPAGTDLALKTSCSANTGRGADFRICDTGMVVTYRLGSTEMTLFNDDGPLAEVGGNGRGSFIRPGLFSQETVVTIYVFSMGRATSSTQLLARPDQGWVTLEPSLEVGGTLVNVGPLQKRDFLEVMTPNNGAGDDNTQMLLFNARTQSTSALFSQDQLPPDPPLRSGDGDPRINIADDAWSGTNFVLLGKQGRSSASNRGVETRVDLIHGPLDSNPSSTRLDWGMWLAPGRYYVWIEAGTDSPVGNYGSGALPEPHPASDMDGSTALNYWKAFNRGAPNGEALVMRLENWNDGSPITLQERTVPRGAFGSLVSISYNRFLFEVELTQWTNVVVTIPSKAKDAFVWPDWWARRNPDASELKVATFNMLYEKDYEEAKFKNASNLLSTRGSIIRNDLRVEERLDQAPWQWEVDVIGLQEVRRKCRGEALGCVIGPPSNFHVLADIFRDEAIARGSLAWQYVNGRDEQWFNIPWTSKPGMGPLFVSQYFWKTTNDASSIFFGTSARHAAGCTETPLEYAECHLSGHVFGPGISNYTMPAKAVVRRYGDGRSDRPIAVFNMHLEAGSTAIDAKTRTYEIDSLISTISKLLAAEPAGFNRSGVRDPMHHENRILLLGDFNMHPHGRGEHYWMLKKLRDRFGYAVDAALAVRDSEIKLTGMHGAGAYNQKGLPAGYQSREQWKDADPPRPLPDGFPSTFGVFPWWAATSRGEGGGTTPDYGDRLDGVFLVGLGWAMDDPVVAYDVMSDRQLRSRMNPDQGGVEMWPSSASDPGVVVDWPSTILTYFEGSRPNYAPNYELGAGMGTHAGAPALRSDHRPVGVRLRVFER